MEWPKLDSRKIGHSYTCEIERGKSDTQMLFHTKTCPLINPSQYVALWKTHNCSNRASQTLHTSTSHHSCPLRKHDDAQNSKCSFPLSFMQYLFIPNKVYKPSSFNLLHETAWPIGGYSFQSKQSLIFLFNTGRLLKFPFTTNWKCLWINVPVWSTEHKPAKHSSSKKRWCPFHPPQL